MLPALLALTALLLSPAQAGKRELGAMLSLVSDPALRTLMQSRELPPACEQLLQQTRRRVSRADRPQALLMVSYEDPRCADWWQEIASALELRLGGRISSSGDPSACPDVTAAEALTETWTTSLVALPRDETSGSALEGESPAQPALSVQEGADSAAEPDPGVERSEPARLPGSAAPGWPPPQEPSAALLALGSCGPEQDCQQWRSQADLLLERLEAARADLERACVPRYEALIGDFRARFPEVHGDIAPAPQRLHSLTQLPAQSLAWESRWRAQHYQPAVASAAEQQARSQARERRGQVARQLLQARERCLLPGDSDYEYAVTEYAVHEARTILESCRHYQLLLARPDRPSDASLPAAGAAVEQEILRIQSNLAAIEAAELRRQAALDLLEQQCREEADISAEVEAWLDCMAEADVSGAARRQASTSEAGYRELMESASLSCAHRSGAFSRIQAFLRRCEPAGIPCEELDSYLEPSHQGAAGSYDLCEVIESALSPRSSD